MEKNKIQISESQLKKLIGKIINEEREEMDQMDPVKKYTVVTKNKKTGKMDEKVVKVIDVQEILRKHVDEKEHDIISIKLNSRY